MQYRLPTIVVLLLLAMNVSGQEPSRFIAKLLLPNGQTVMVAEGAFEAGLQGSYSVRLYKAPAINDTQEGFLHGLVASRSAPITAVLASNVCGDQQPDIIIHFRSQVEGNGSSVHAFNVVDQTLQACMQVNGLKATQDPLLALLKSAH